ncbi:MAG: hypothetical protein IPH45_21510 [Bacteroidales bacterium]|nr:hypothetical protein [Bacteroidales bacterium]
MEKHFSRLSLKNYRTIFDSAFPQINLQTGTGNAIKSWIISDIAIISGFRRIHKILSNIMLHLATETADEVDAHLTAWQIIAIKDKVWV